MDIKIERTEYEYIPEWNGNKEDANPIKATISLLTPAQRDDCYDYEFGGPEVMIKPNMKQFVRLGVKAISNLTVDGKAVTDGRILCATIGLDGLYSELATEVIRANTRQDLKNL